MEPVTPVPDVAPDVAAPVPPPVAPVEEEEERKKRRLLLLLFLLLLLLVGLGLFSAWYLMYRKPVTELVPPFGQDAVPAYMFSVYGATKPMGVAVNAAGDRIYVTESDGARLVQVFDRNGQPQGDLLPPDSKQAHAPVYVAVDPQNDEVYVTDRLTGAIYIYDTSGAYSRTFQPKEPIPAWQPLGVAFSPAGDLWVTDLSAPFHRIEVFDREGNLKQTIGSKDEFDFPNMVAFDKAGNAYLSDSNTGRLAILDPAGNQLAGISRGAGEGALGLPRGVAIDDTGRLYVVDATGHAVHLYRTGTAPEWRPTFVADFGSQGVANGQFEYPNGVATDTRARIYVTDRENDRVQVWGY